MKEKIKNLDIIKSKNSTLWKALFRQWKDKQRMGEFGKHIFDEGLYPKYTKNFQNSTIRK